MKLKFINYKVFGRFKIYICESGRKVKERIGEHLNNNKNWQVGGWSDYDYNENMFWVRMIPIDFIE